MKNNTILASIICGSIVIAGCSNQNTSDLSVFIQKTKQSNLGVVDPLPIFAPYQKFLYASDTLRDPFKPSTAQLTGMISGDYDGPMPDQARNKEPLESFPLDSLKMVGLLQQKKQTWGLIRDPNGTIHRIKPGNYAGQNNGKISNVDEIAIEILELVPDGLSGWVNRTAKLAMRDE